MRKRKIMSSTPAYDERMDERFDAEIPDEFEIYDRIGKAYCKVADYTMIGSNVALATIGIISFDNYFDADEYVERGLGEFFDDIFNGSDYYSVVYEIKRGLPKYMDEYDIIGDADYSESYKTFTVNVKITSSEHDDFADDAYFSASRKIGNKRPVKASVGSSSYDTKLIAKYVKETYDDSASSRIRSFGHMSNAEKYMNRNSLIYDSKNKLILFYDMETKEKTPIFKVIPQHSNIKKYGMYAPKEPILEPVDSCDDVMSSHSSSRKVGRGREVFSSESFEDQENFEDRVSWFYNHKLVDQTEIYDRSDKFYEIFEADAKLRKEIFDWMYEYAYYDMDESNIPDPDNNMDELFADFLDELYFQYEQSDNSELYYDGSLAEIFNGRTIYD